MALSMSFVREYFDDGSNQTSKEWAICPYDHESGAYAAPGDSGAVVVDGQGCISGVLTGSSGSVTDSDITYVTPISFLLESIKANGVSQCLRQRLPQRGLLLLGTISFPLPPSVTSFTLPYL
jgi:hypothetical protein